MLGFIKRRMPGEKIYEKKLSFLVPHPGSENTDKFKCSQPGIFFTAEVTNILYELDELEAEQQCHAGEITFVFREKQYAEILRKATEGSLPFSGSTVAGDIVKYHIDLKNALETEDSSAALIKSSQLYDSLLQAGYKQVAEPYRILNLDLAKTKLKSVGMLKPYSGDLFFDPMQKKYVLDDNSIALIKEFQSDKNLVADGKLNWRTMELLGKVNQ
jgi:hypothetical protein